MTARVLFSALCCVVFLRPAEARPVARWRGFELELSGSLREVAVATRGTNLQAFERAISSSLPSPDCVLPTLFPDCPAFGLLGEQNVWQSLTRLRTRWDFRSGKTWTLVLVYDHELLAGAIRTLEADPAASVGSQAALPLEETISGFDFGGSADGGRWRHLLYRAYLRYRDDRWDVVAGRQRIAWGVGRLWRPLDRLAFVPPLAIEADQSPGVDGISVRFAFTGFTSLEAVAVPEATLLDSAYALRLRGFFRDTDYALVGGIFREAPAGGIEVARNLGDVAVRAEAAYTEPLRSVRPLDSPESGRLRGFWQVVLSADRNFDLGQGLYVLAEYLYNGNALGFGRGLAGPFASFFEAKGADGTDVAPAQFSLAHSALPAGPAPPETLVVVPTSAARFGGSQVVSFGRHQTGLEVAYETTFALGLDAFVLFDWEGPSAAFVPAVRYEPFGFLEWTLGAQLFAGPRRSEFGLAEDTLFLLAEAFF
ncbi:MAG: hypothetical protein KatS3mg076_1483 [Candidatus Binatia bacterium]|nr:MAG: hypothetical protein KatS3mg076_1483 [Candidatus Binatia bacterium]